MGIKFQSGCQALLHVGKGAHPILRLGSMALSGGIFGEKNVARPKGLDRSVADTYLDRAGEGDTPLPAGSSVPA
jgi:hypothetical protein